MVVLTKILNDPKKKFIFFLALLFLIVNSYWNLHSARLIDEALLEEKLIETINCVDMLCAAIDANPELDWWYHEENIKVAMTFADSMPMTFAAAYKPVDSELVLITERDYATNFEPFLFEEFLTAIDSKESGELILGFTPENGKYRDVRIYYRWLPAYSPDGEQYLVVAGVSKYSVTVSISAIFTIGQWISTIILTILFLIFIYLDAVLGYIWFKRGKEPWRDETGGDYDYV